MQYRLTEGLLDPPAAPHTIDALSSALGSSLPRSYLDFLQQHNGGEGFIGENYIILWKAEELVDFNREYEVDKYAPGILLFASTGGGEGYGFDTQSTSLPIVQIPFVGMDRRHATLVAQDLQDLFARLAEEQ
jgi:SMI1 / KNR4 family (SUKH-1)